MAESNRAPRCARCGVTLALALLSVACAEPHDDGESGAAHLNVLNVGVIEQQVAAGGPNPAPIPVVLTNSGPCWLDYSASAATASGGDWLSIDPVVGMLRGDGDAGTLNVGLDVVTTALQPGTYTGTIELLGTCQTNGQPALGSPLPIGVNLLVTPSLAVYTVGGVVTGLSGAQVALQNSGADLLFVKSDGPFAFPVADGADYDVTVAEQPPGSTCDLSNGTGTVAGADVSDVVVDCARPVEPLYGGPDLWWNDYVLNDGATWFDASGTPCDGSEPGPYAVCLHAAEMLAVTVGAAADCAGLEATDALGAFEWTCFNDGASVRMISVALRDEARLADLIDAGDPEPQWRENSVTVTEGGAPLFTSQPSVWYGNPLVVPVLSNVATPIDTPGTVVVIPGDDDGSLSIGSAGVAVVVMPGVTLTRLGSVSGIVAAQPGADLLWIEGDLATGSELTGVRLDGTRRSVVRHVTGRNAPIRLVGASANRLADVRVQGGNIAFHIDVDSSWNQAERVVVGGFNPSGVRIDGSNNVVVDVVAAHGRFAFDFGRIAGTPAASNVIVDATSAVAQSTGMRIENAPLTTAMNLAGIDLGIGLDIDADARVHNVAMADSFLNDDPTYGTGVRVHSDTTPNITGLLVLGNNAHNCQLDLDFTPDPCSHAKFASFFDDVEFEPADPDEFEPPNQLTLVAAFVGQAYLGEPPVDVTNAHGADGWWAYPEIVDFVHFDNRYRGWGRRGTSDEPEVLYAFPSAAIKGECGSGTCGIWDWSAASDDLIIRERLRLPTGDNAFTAVHRWTVADEAECAAVPGAVWGEGTCQVEFLLNAFELTRDAVGNDNLLCEPGERCLATRNIGAYQGHGALLPVPEPGGLAGDIELFEHHFNGR